MNFLTTLAKIIVVPLVLVLGAAGYHFQTQSYGATGNAGANALYEQSLAQPLGTTDANMYVTSGADVQGNLLPLNSYQCLSVDTGQPNFEAVCGTVTTSSTAGLTLLVSLRGLSTQTATTSNASFIFTHRRGADVRITDFPALTVVNNELNGVQNIPNLLTYDQSVLITGTSPSTTVATKYYVDNTVTSGAPNATTLVKGIVQLANSAQAALGTILGSTGASLVLSSSLSTSTPYNSGSNVVPITGINEKLSQLFLDLTQQFNFSSIFTTLASSTNATSTNFTVTNNALFNGAATFNGAVNGLTSLSTSFTAGQTITTAQAVNVLPYPVNQITYDNSSNFSATGSSVTQSFTVGANSNRGLIVDLITGGADASGITYAGVSMTKENSTSITGSTDFLDQWYLSAPATGSNSIIITLGGSQAINAIAYSYYNIAQSGQPELKSAQGGTNCSASLTPLTNGDLLSGVAYSSSGPAGGTVYTNNKVTNAGNTSMQAGDSGNIYPPSAQTITSSGGGTNNGCQIVAFAPIMTSATPRVYIADNTQSWTATSTIGFAVNSSTAGNPITIQTDGIYTGLSGLTIGLPYYLTANGALTSTIPSILHKLGISTSATSLLITNIY